MIEMIKIILGVLALAFATVMLIIKGNKGK